MKCGMMCSGTSLTQTKEFLEIIDMILSYINERGLNVLHRDKSKVIYQEI